LAASPSSRHDDLPSERAFRRHRIFGGLAAAPLACRDNVFRIHLDGALSRSRDDRFSIRVLAPRAASSRDYGFHGALSLVAFKRSNALGGGRNGLERNPFRNGWIPQPDGAEEDVDKPLSLG
jgi:hypothetical protein